MEPSAVLVWNAERLRIAADAAGVALWSWNVETGELSMDGHGYTMWGMQRIDPLTFEALSSQIIDDDHGNMRRLIEATRTEPGRYAIEFRIMRGSETRYITARGLGLDEGIIGQVMFGVFLDVTASRLAEEARATLAAEMSHRVKNVFAVASAMVAIAARSTKTPTDMAVDLRQRLDTLWRAHELIRPDPENVRYEDALLADLFTVSLAPFDNSGTVGDRIRVPLPKVSVGRTSATALSLIAHELATNSVKYGSLSRAGGTLDVSGADDGESLTMVWTERGGPPVTARGPAGFGTMLISRSAIGQLGGSITYDWLGRGSLSRFIWAKTA
jgi:two-component sensor histidine kinase